MVHECVGGQTNRQREFLGTGVFGQLFAEPVPLHKDPDGLTDDLPAADGTTQVVHLVGVPDCDRGAAREDGSDELAGRAERAPPARVRLSAPIAPWIAGSSQPVVAEAGVRWRTARVARPCQLRC
jgi:hypothetical protein